MTHNFTLSKTRLSNDKAKDYWECLNCDSGVLIPKRGYTQHDVNQFMESKAPCLPPIAIVGNDAIVDNRTTIINPKSRFIIPGKH